MGPINIPDLSSNGDEGSRPNPDNVSVTSVRVIKVMENRQYGLLFKSE
jgi:hypothetical protein